MFTETQRGQFYIDEVIMKKYPLTVMELMGKVIIIKCEFLYDRLRFHYVALSPEFAPISSGECTPFYRVERNSDNSFSFIKEDRSI